MKSVIWYCAKILLNNTTNLAHMQSLKTNLFFISMNIHIMRQNISKLILIKGKQVEVKRNLEAFDMYKK